MNKILKSIKENCFVNIKKINFIFFLYSFVYIFASSNMNEFANIFGEITLLVSISSFLIYFVILFVYDLIFIFLSSIKGQIYKKIQINISNKILLYILSSIFYIASSIGDINITNQYYYDNMYLLKYTMLIIGLFYVLLFLKHKIQFNVFKKTSYSILIILLLNIYVVNGNLINILKPTIIKINRYLETGPGEHTLKLGDSIPIN